MKTLLSAARSSFGFFAIALLAGCDGGSGAPMCGGDIVGTWNITSSNVSVTYAASSDPDCPTATAKAVDFKVTGTATYNADLTYTTSHTFDVKVAVTKPRTCLGTGTCADLEVYLQGNPALTSASCVAAGTGCTCTLGFPPETMSETGTYTTAGGMLTETPTGGQAEVSSYCVQGTLTASLNAAMGDAVAMGTLTYTKQ